MPFKDPEKQAAYDRERMRKKRENAAYREQEAKTKAKWYQENKQAARDNLRNFREKIRQQAILNTAKRVSGDE